MSHDTIATIQALAPYVTLLMPYVMRPFANRSKVIDSFAGGGGLAMDTNAIIAAIDDEIQRLQQARKLLGKSEATTERKPGTKTQTPKKAKRKLSAEARARIAEAQKKRWAKAKKNTTKKTETPS